MSEEKTLGQIYVDGGNSICGDSNMERDAAGIAAVARHVVAEMLSKHVAECHRVKPRTVKVDDDESAMMIGHEEPPQPDAGDWATKVVDSGWRTGCELEKNIREAADRHYGPNPPIGSVRYYEQQLELLRQGLEKISKERDAAVAEIEQLKKQPDETSCLGVLMKIGDLLQLSGPIVNPGKVLEAAEKLVKPQVVSGAGSVGYEG